VEYVPGGLSRFRVIWPKFDEVTFNSPLTAWQTNQPFSGVPSWFGRTRAQHLSVVMIDFWNGRWVNP
jgi:hypothetical protein